MAGARCRWRPPSRPTAVVVLLSVLAFVAVLILITTSNRKGSAVKYYVMHLLIAIEIFLLGAGIHLLLARLLNCVDSSWLCGFLTALPFYISREIRDAEKLGRWDWPGLWWPTVGVVVLLVVLEAAGLAWRWRTGAERSPV